MPEHEMNGWLDFTCMHEMIGFGSTAHPIGSVPSPRSIVCLTELEGYLDTDTPTLTNEHLTNGRACSFLLMEKGSRKSIRACLYPPNQWEWALFPRHFSLPPTPEHAKIPGTVQKVGIARGASYIEAIHAFPV